VNAFHAIFPAMKMENSGEQEDREVRSIQLTGRGSYVVSIPKHWVQETGMKKGGRVEFIEQRGEGLLLKPFAQTRLEDEQPRCEILIPPDATPDAVARRIISLYVVGYSTIEVNSKSGNLSPSIRDGIRDMARHKLVGTELVNESSRSATLQVLLSFPQLLVPDALRRMSSIMNSMQHDAMQALASSDRELANQVVKIDDEIDRFSLYIIRQLKWAVQHLPLLERIGLTSPVECLGYRIITKSVERSADHAARVAENSLLLQHTLNSTILKGINTLSQNASKMMEAAVQALFVRDYQLAESVLIDREKISALECKLVEHLLKAKMPASELSALRLISESLRRIGEYATDIAEVVLNLTVQESIEGPIRSSRPPEKGTG
jgi:phosphate uptake regulator